MSSPAKTTRARTCTGRLHRRSFTCAWLTRQHSKSLHPPLPRGRSSPTMRLPKASTLRLRIVGNGPLEATLVKRINGSRYHDRIELISKDTVSWWGYLQTCRMFISMSHYEGNPNAVLEAMAGGCALIVSNISAHHEILDTNSALFVDLDNMDDLVNAIVNVDSEFSEALKRSSNARVRVMGMTDTKMALEYESVYSNL